MGRAKLTAEDKAARKAEEQRAQRARIEAVDCTYCTARAGFPCVDFKGQPKEPCAERGRPEVLAKKLAKKAAEINAKKLKAVGGGNTLLTYLHGSDDALLAAEGETKVTPAELLAARNHAETFKENEGHAEWDLRVAFNWIAMRHLRREAANLIGAEWERILWEGAHSIHGNALDYIFGRYADCLCTTKSFALGYERKFDPARVKTWYLEPNEYRKERLEMKNDGWYVVPTGTWPPDGYTPVMTREEFAGRFKLRHSVHSERLDFPEPDDGGLFDRTIGELKREAA